MNTAFFVKPLFNRERARTFNKLNIVKYAALAPVFIALTMLVGCKSTGELREERSARKTEEKQWKNLILLSA
jgi:hypothetical protein